MKISVLLPSRENPLHLTETVQSFFDTCSPDNHLEILIAVDDDDASRLSVMNHFKGNNSVKFYERPAIGFYNLHLYINFLAGEATGDIFFIFSDKTLVKTKHWDKLLKPYKEKFIVASPFTDWNDPLGTYKLREDILFPIISKMWYKVLGKVCDYPHIDSSIDWTIRRLCEFPDGESMFKRIRFLLPDMRVAHDRRKDISIQKIGQTEFFTNEANASRLKDAGVIYAFLKKHPQYIP